MEILAWVLLCATDILINFRTIYFNYLDRPRIFKEQYSRRTTVETSAVFLDAELDKLCTKVSDAVFRFPGLH